MHLAQKMKPNVKVFEFDLSKPFEQIIGTQPGDLEGNLAKTSPGETLGFILQETKYIND